MSIMVQASDPHVLLGAGSEGIQAATAPTSVIITVFGY